MLLHFGFRMRKWTTLFLMLVKRDRTPTPSPFAFTKVLCFYIAVPYTLCCHENAKTEIKNMKKCANFEFGLGHNDSRLFMATGCAFLPSVLCFSTCIGRCHRSISDFLWCASWFLCGSWKINCNWSIWKWGFPRASAREGKKVGR